jgi:hypothetical protein
MGVGIWSQRCNVIQSDDTRHARDPWGWLIQEVNEIGTKLCDLALENRAFKLFVVGMNTATIQTDH